MTEITMSDWCNETFAAWLEGEFGLGEEVQAELLRRMATQPQPTGDIAGLLDDIEGYRDDLSDAYQRGETESVCLSVPELLYETLNDLRTAVAELEAERDRYRADAILYSHAINESAKKEIVDSLYPTADGDVGESDKGVTIDGEIYYIASDKLRTAVADLQRRVLKQDKLIQAFRCASCLVTSSGDAEGITPHHVEMHIATLQRRVVELEAERAAYQDSKKEAHDENGS